MRRWRAPAARPNSRRCRSTSRWPAARGKATAGRRIAFIQGDGQINDGKSEVVGFGGSTSMGGDTIAKAFRDATDDDDVKAILFRVNSPGGSALASDQILDAVKKAQKAGKKVVVSMGDVAASGGYYVSLSADKIFAHETTITGSIGVLSGKLVTAGSWALLGIDLKSARRRHERADGCRRPSRSRRSNGRSSTAASTRSMRTSPPRSRPAARCRSRKSARSPRAAFGPAPTPRRAAWSTSSAVSAPRSRRRKRWPASPPTREINLQALPGAEVAVRRDRRDVRHLGRSRSHGGHAGQGHRLRTRHRVDAHSGRRRQAEPGSSNADDASEDELKQQRRRMNWARALELGRTRRYFTS